jgi:plasmid stabilization system protein ParE
LIDYELAEEAIADIDSIWLYLLNRASLETADRVVAELFLEFDALARSPHRGHRRRDLTSRSVLFSRVYSFLIVYEWSGDQVTIIGVLHGKRDIAQILRERS